MNARLILIRRTHKATLRHALDGDQWSCPRVEFFFVLIRANRTPWQSCLWLICETSQIVTGFESLFQVKKIRQKLKPLALKVAVPLCQ